MGIMDVPSQPPKVFECSYDDCPQVFGTESELKFHLKKSGDHPFYCGKTPSPAKLNDGFVKCDFHGKTWEDLVTHKVENMLPWLVGEYADKKPKKLNHIVCEFCGVDFESMSGREAHRKMMHQADQHIACKGFVVVSDGQGNSAADECGAMFGRASQLINHVENGYCAYMHANAFQYAREDRKFVNLVMDVREEEEAHRNPPVDEFARQYQETSDAVSTGKVSGDCIDDWIDAGTGLASDCDQDEDAQPDMDGMQQKFEDWPLLSESRNHPTVKGIKVKSTAPPTTESWLRKITSSEYKVKGWDKDATRRRQEDAHHTFPGQIWNPNHANFDPESFYDPIDVDGPAYMCPISTCLTRYHRPEDVGFHINEKHLDLKRVCPSCNKSFKKLSGLVSHFEDSSAGSRCQVARSPGYETLLEEVTGGLLTVSKATSQPIYGHKLANDGDASRQPTVGTPQWESPGSGVKDYVYQAMQPKGSSGIF